MFIKDSVTELNKYINFVLNNIDLLEFDYIDKFKLLSDSFIYYYSIFILDKHSKIKENQANYLNANPVIETIINFYYMKLSSEDNFNIFQELKILNIISQDFGFKNTEFWDLAADKIKGFFLSEFSKQLLNLVPKRIKDSKDNFKRYEINTTSSIFYCGLIIETFLAADYVNEQFWELTLEKISNIINLSNKEPIIILHFIYLYCSKILIDIKFNNIYKIFVDKLLNDKLKAVFEKKEVIEYLIKVNFFDSIIDVGKLNYCLNKLFGNVNQGVNKPVGITQFIIFFNLFENKLFDIMKISEERLTEKILQLKMFKRNIDKNIEKIIYLINERLIFLIKTSESKEDNHKNEEIVKCLIYSEIFTKLELTKLIFKLKKDGVDSDKMKFLDDILMSYTI